MISKSNGLYNKDWILWGSDDLPNNGDCQKVAILNNLKITAETFYTGGLITIYKHVLKIKVPYEQKFKM